MYCGEEEGDAEQTEEGEAGRLRQRTIAPL
jgi:hypothetical protein